MIPSVRPRPRFRGGELQRGPRATDRGLWIPSRSAFTRVLDALGGGLRGGGCHASPLVPAVWVRPPSRLRGRVGEGAASTNLVVCPLPVPPPQAGEGTQEPHESRRRLYGGEGRRRTQRRLARCYGRDQRGRDPC